MSDEKESKRSDESSKVIDLKQTVGRLEGGTVIGAKIGQVLGNLTVNETRIINLGGIIIPVWLVLAIVGAVVVLAVGTWLIVVPAKMTNPFNVAVAEFGVADAQGNVQTPEELENFSRATHTALKNGLASVPARFNPLIWHDVMFPMEMRTRIGAVPGANAQERADNAAKLARTIGADVLFYGTLDKDEAAFNLNFYVQPQLSGSTNEVVGAHQLGAPIPATDLADPVSRTRLNRELTIRTSILSRFTLGLLYVLAGYPDDALQVLTQINERSDAIGSGLQEIVYFFIGEEYLYKDKDEEALAAFRKALEINPQYARAQLGVGGVFLLRADRTQPRERLDKPELEQAIAEFQKALALTPLAAGAPTDILAHLALGTAYRAKGEAYLHRGEYDSANQFFDKAIAEIEPSVSVLAAKKQFRYLGAAYLGLAESYHQKGYIPGTRGDKEASRMLYLKAAGYYDLCIKQAEASPYDVLLKQEIEMKCKPYRKLIDDALAAN